MRDWGHPLELDLDEDRVPERRLLDRSRTAKAPVEFRKPGGMESERELWDRLRKRSERDRKSEWGMEPERLQPWSSKIWGELREPSCGGMCPEKAW